VSRATGDPKQVIDAYLLDVARGEDEALGSSVSRLSTAQSAREPEPEDLSKAGEGRWGSREAEVVSVELVGPAGVAHVFESGARLQIRLGVRAHQPLEDVVVGIGIFNAEGTCCYGTNTRLDGAPAGALSGDGEAWFEIERLDLVEGTYKLDVAVHRSNGAPYDYHRLLHTFRVTSRTRDVGIYRPPHRWTFRGGLHISNL
jgi:hypothetical protein